MDPEASAFDDDIPMEVEEEKKDYSNEIFQFVQHMEVHTGAVKGVAVKTIMDASSGASEEKGLLLSGSFDQSCKLFTLNNLSGRYEFIQEFNHHDHYVYNVASMNGDGFITCGKDKRIFILDNNGNPIKMFEGHEGLVNTVISIDDKTIVSGSWDGTAKVWDIETSKCIATLEGHSHAVSVLIAPDGRIITGSQDKKIKIWGTNYKLEKEWEAHGDIVREFADFSPIGFVSCSNDGTLKVWTYDGDQIGELTGHTSYVFTVKVLPNNLIVSGSDDKTIKVWKDFQATHTISIPDTIWGIDVNHLGDIVVACQDKRIYVFSRDPSRHCHDKELQEFQANLKAAETPDHLELGTVPTTEEMAQNPGKKEGEIKVFKDNGVPKAYSWKPAERKWELIGEVQLPSAPPSDNGTKYYEGDRLFEAGDYDHVFDVEIGDGVMRKLPFNNGENPDEAANKFCVREGFGRGNVEQIIKFIKTNSVDYATRDLSAAKGKGDANKAKPKLKSIPMQTYLFYEAVKTDKPAEKILESNKELNSIEEKEIKNFERLIKVISEKHLYHSSELLKLEWDVFYKLLSWPSKHIMPVIDLFRMFLLHSQASEMFKIFEKGAEHLTMLLALLENPEEPTPVHLLSLRCLSNMFKHPSSTFVLISKYEKIMDVISDYIAHDNKNIRNAAITIFLNYSISFLSRTEDNQGRVQAIACLVDALENEKDGKNFMRVIAAIGNFMFGDEEVISLAKDLGVVEKAKNVESLKGNDVYDKSKMYADEIQIMAE